MKNPKEWLFNDVWTLDVHDEKHSTKKIPRKKYMEHLVDIWMKEKLLLIDKSRQMMISWLFVALHLWDAMYHDGRHYYFVSKKADDANAILDRAKFIYYHLPEELKVAPVHDKYCLLEFPERNSKIEAVSQESDAIRSRTATGIFDDEMAFQQYAHEIYAAARPTIEGGGRFTGVSTANGKEFHYRLCYDLE